MPNTVNPFRKFGIIFLGRPGPARPVGGSFGLVWPPGWLWALQRPLALIKQINKTPRAFSFRAKNNLFYF